MAMWNPWRGCHKYSEDWRFCYIHKGDQSLMTLTWWEKYCFGMLDLAKRTGWSCT